MVNIRKRLGIHTGIKAHRESSMDSRTLDHDQTNYNVVDYSGATPRGMNKQDPNRLMPVGESYDVEMRRDSFFQNTAQEDEIMR